MIPAVDLTALETDFLTRLLDGPWTAPPTFDHELVARLIELGLVETEASEPGEIEYRLTEAGRAQTTG